MSLQSAIFISCPMVRRNNFWQIQKLVVSKTSWSPRRDKKQGFMVTYKVLKKHLSLASTWTLKAVLKDPLLKLFNWKTLMETGVFWRKILTQPTIDLWRFTRMSTQLVTASWPRTCWWMSTISTTSFRTSILGLTFRRRSRRPTSSRSMPRERIFTRSTVTNLMAPSLEACSQGAVLFQLLNW